VGFKVSTVIAMIQSKPLVTVYLVNHNYGSYIKRAIDSVLQQSLQDFELIIIDDGSTDNSKEVILSYENLKGVSVVFQSNKGLTVTNNIALNLAKGKYIMRLDADDWLDENALSLLANSLELDPNLGMVFPDYYLVDENGELKELVRRHNFEEVSLFDQPAHGACTMFRVKDLMEIGGYDESYSCQDGYQIWFHFIKNHKIKNINLPLFYYRQHLKSLTKDVKLILDTRAQIFQKFISSQESDCNSIAVIPIRGNSFQGEPDIYRKLGGKMLIKWTLDLVISLPRIKYVIVTTPDKNLISWLGGNYNSQKLVPILRSKELARVNMSYDDAVQKGVEEFERTHGAIFESVVVMSISSPFRTNSQLTMAVDALNLFDLDCVVPVKHETSNFYKHDGHGLKMINGYPSLRLEGSEIYREISGFKVFSRHGLLRIKDPNQNKTGHINIDSLSEFNISSEIDWEVGEVLTKAFLEKYG
jgi:glycosyltransferase involved in cell wall biosynthesis